MTDATGAKTMAVLLAIVLVGTFLYVARVTRRGASAQEVLMPDAITHAQETARTPRGVKRHAARARGGAAAVVSQARVANRALDEMGALERARRAAEGDWRSQRGAPGRLDNWQP